MPGAGRGVAVGRVTNERGRRNVGRIRGSTAGGKPFGTLSLGATLIALLVACNTPTIPLPPPSPDPEDVVVAVYAEDSTKLVFEADSDTRQSSFPPNAVVTILNLETGYGTIVTADARGQFVSDPVTGAVGDPISIRYTDEEGAESGELCVFARIGRQGDDNLC